jgi:hypothetical protein
MCVKVYGFLHIIRENVPPYLHSHHMSPTENLVEQSPGPPKVVGRDRKLNCSQITNILFMNCEPIVQEP